jgi:hypothetical protein
MISSIEDGASKPQSEKIAACEISDAALEEEAEGVEAGVAEQPELTVHTAEIRGGRLVFTMIL